MAYFPLGPLAPDRNPRLNDEVLRVADGLRFTLRSANENGPKRGSRPAPALTDSEWRFAVAKRQLPSPAEVRQLLDYDPETGRLFWKVRPLGPKQWNSRYAGKEAFTARMLGYRQGSLFKRHLLAHRVIWALVCGEWPAEEIDHINGNREDNRIVNLRAVSATENKRNHGWRKAPANGVVGVRYRSVGKLRWNARIGKQDLGRFATKDEAVAARREAEMELGYHPNHGMRAAS